MSILTGYNKYKRYIKTDGGYKLVSQWTSSNTIHMDDGNTAETNLGAIQGLTSSLATDNGSYALSASAGKSLQDQVTTLNSNLTTKYDIPQTIGGIASSQPYTCKLTGFTIVTIKSWHTQTLPLEGQIFLNGEVIASNYFTFTYQSLVVTIPVKKGDVISCTEGFNFSLRTIY